MVSDFKVQSILKNKKLSKISKRMLSSLEHHKFRTRLEYQAKKRGNKVYFVDESYTSKTCCSCGDLNYNLGASKVFKCENKNCQIEIDRDINGARNILNKNWEVLPVALQVGY